ncbi:MAG: bifunctional phosphoribosyl-AMP cyclohydrolase/phosphoribosyl-ATP diphosphatase HisIE [Chitinophagales bacterium]|nr:bifunctional phosphoribosyl-AMP cyclohydrolase/phosphoribosyl-ATP diphosphatase HisIE [Chitinophagales bacterium]
MKPDFEKHNGLIPAIIQHYYTHQVLMLGFMNEEAYQKTLDEKIVTFYSRSKKRLWTKGETSGNILKVKEILTDCDNDTLLIKVETTGPTCHTGSTSCFKEESDKGFLYLLQHIVEKKMGSNDINSYTAKLVQKGLNKIIQKFGEEAIELAIEAKDDNPDLFKNEAADLLYHLIVLLRYKNISLEDIEAVLSRRNQEKNN